MAMFPVFDPPAKVVCAACSEEISGVRIKCAECVDIELCLQCFSVGVELGAHKNDHSYKFVETDAADVFKSKIGWTANEELLLLRGIEEFGFGNWEDISNHIETRTPEEAKEEYFARFVDGAIGEATWPRAFEFDWFSPTPSETKEEYYSRYVNGAAAGEPRWTRAFAKCVDHTGTLESQIKTEQGFEDGLDNVNSNGEYGEASNSMSDPSTLDTGVNPELLKQLGYMPGRDSYEWEYDNNAESIIAHINLGDVDGDEIETALVLSQIDIYLHRLRERHRRKFVIKEYQLISQFFNLLSENQTQHKHTCSEETELEEQLKWLCQFHSSTEHYNLIKSLMRQKMLERRFAELIRMRTYEEAARYDQDRHVRDVTDSRSAELDGSENGSGSDSPAHQALGNFPVGNFSDRLQLATNSSTLPRKRKKQSDNYSLAEKSIFPSSLAATELQPKQLFCKEPDHLLSRTESQLCLSLDITPSQYISLKTSLLLASSDEPIENEIEKRVQDHLTLNRWFIS